MANSKGITTGENSPSTIAGIKRKIVEKDLTANNIDPVNPTNKELEEAQTRINELKKKFCEKNNISYKPFDLKFFGDRSAAELNKFAQWMEENHYKFKTKEEAKQAGRAYLSALDTEFKYNNPLNPLKQKDFKFYEVDPATVTAPTIAKTTNTQTKTIEEAKSPVKPAPEPTKFSEVKDGTLLQPPLAQTPQPPPLIAR